MEMATTLTPEPTNSSATIPRPIIGRKTLKINSGTNTTGKEPVLGFYPTESMAL